MSDTSLTMRLDHWLRNGGDDAIMRGIFGAALCACVIVVGLDYLQLEDKIKQDQAGLPQVNTPSATPLPSSSPRDGETRSAPPVESGRDALRQAMSFDLRNDGRMVAEGTITPGTAQTFAAEIEKRGGYVKTVVLNSPGGSVSDALEMGRLIREKKFATAVEGAHYCASSCPLVFAGGVARSAGPKAAIGVHQISVIAPGNVGEGTRTQDAQRTTAVIQRYLRDMDIDAEVWGHALETPPDALYYFKPDEMLKLRLTTPPASPSAAAPAVAPAPDRSAKTRAEKKS